MWRTLYKRRQRQRGADSRRASGQGGIREKGDQGGGDGKNFHQTKTWTCEGCGSEYFTQFKAFCECQVDPETGEPKCAKSASSEEGAVVDLDQPIWFS